MGYNYWSSNQSLNESSDLMSKTFKVKLNVAQTAAKENIIYV